MTVFRKSQTTCERGSEGNKKNPKESHCMQSTNDKIIREDENLVDFLLCHQQVKMLLKYCLVVERRSSLGEEELRMMNREKCSDDNVK